MTMTCCKHCGRMIVSEGGVWVDPEATGDDRVWRETCEGNDTFTAEHEPMEGDAMTTPNNAQSRAHTDPKGYLSDPTDAEVAEVQARLESAQYQAGYNDGTEATMGAVLDPATKHSADYRRGWDAAQSDLRENFGPNDGSEDRWEVTVSFRAPRERDAQAIVAHLAKRLEGGDEDFNVREFTLRAVEYLA